MRSRRRRAGRRRPALEDADARLRFRLRARQPYLAHRHAARHARDWHSDDHTNYLGTYTFESLAAYDAGRPRSYTRRIGDPNIDYSYFQGALYGQDDFRIRRNLTLSGGVRYEAQNHVDDLDNVMPRLGVTWAPGTARHDDAARELGHLHTTGCPNGTYEQTLRVDG